MRGASLPALLLAARLCTAQPTGTSCSTINPLVAALALALAGLCSTATNPLALVAALPTY